MSGSSGVDQLQYQRSEVNEGFDGSSPGELMSEDGKRFLNHQNEETFRPLQAKRLRRMETVGMVRILYWLRSGERSLAEKPSCANPSKTPIQSLLSYLPVTESREWSY